MSIHPPLHPTFPRCALACVVSILLLHAAPAPAQDGGCGGDFETPAWGTEGEVESVRRIGEVGGRTLYAEVRRQFGGFSYFHRVMLIRTDTVPLTGCFVVNEAMDAVTAGDEPRAVPTVVQALYHHLSLGPMSLVAEMDGGRTILVERYTAGWQQDDEYTTETWDWDGERYRLKTP